MTQNTRKYLGVGWRFPVRPSTGRLQWAREADDVDQAIEIVLRTAQLERVMLGGFGAGLHDHLFESNTARTHRAVEAEVREALVRFEPRIVLERVRAYATADAPTVLWIDIDYVLRSGNTRQNKVLPFYLQEGA